MSENGAHEEPDSCEFTQSTHAHNTKLGQSETIRTHLSTRTGMMITIWSFLLFTVFAILGGFHFYWLFGGTFGVKQVIPTKSPTAKNEQAIPPFATLIVALGLVSCGLLYLVKAEILILPIASWIIEYGLWFIPSIFILRSIGEFNYVGFFKKIKDTEFAKADSALFSPLCLGIGVTGILIQLLTLK
jgi:fatty acid desaturase